MTTPSNSSLKFFPATHVAAISATAILLLLLILWPSSDQPLRQTSLKVAISPVSALSDRDSSNHWNSDVVKSGDSLSSLFSRNNLSAGDIIEIASVAPRDALTIRPGQEIRWIPGQDNHINALEIQVSALAQHHFERSDEGKLTYSLIERNAEYMPRYASTEINNSLFVDGERAGIPEQVLIELAAIFGWDIDFALDIRPGDALSLIYEEIYLDGNIIGYGDILIAQFINQSREITAIRYEDAEGNSSYYTPDGLSMRKEFLRNPIDFFRISSRFNLRRKHPIYNTIRAHKGTDYAAPTGTPVKAVGDGKITYAGRKGSYGNLIIIKHNNRYETRYAHLNAFHRSVRSGRYVKQGQIIGYVGSTGAATGPHLHYEFRVDGVFRDSLRVNLPKAKSISSSEKASFNRKAEGMMTWFKGLMENPT